MRSLSRYKRGHWPISDICSCRSPSSPSAWRMSAGLIASSALRRRHSAAPRRSLDDGRQHHRPGACDLACRLSPVRPSLPREVLRSSHVGRRLAPIRRGHRRGARHGRPPWPLYGLGIRRWGPPQATASSCASSDIYIGCAGSTPPPSSDGPPTPTHCWVQHLLVRGCMCCNASRDPCRSTRPSSRQWCVISPSTPRSAS